MRHGATHDVLACWFQVVRSTGGGAFRAPAACWWARIEVESTERPQTSPLRFCQIPPTSHTRVNESVGHGCGQHLRCHHANSGSAIGS
ncbi:hypothetical protein [Streptomyces sp. NPDC001933]|uniref:hypothetical protein n=1 Tax=Streptomyces sp. NPDC001933 TaxID=3364626 RepID=UPI0036996159